MKINPRPVPMKPLTGEAADWLTFVRIVEHQILRLIDIRGSIIFQPTTKPLPEGASVPAVEDLSATPWKNRYPLFAFVISGTCQMIFEGRWLSIPAGQGVFVPANAEYAGHAAIKGQIVPCDVLWFSIFPFGVLVHRCQLAPTEHRGSAPYTVMNPLLWDIACAYEASICTDSHHNHLTLKGLLLSFFGLLLQSPVLQLHPQNELSFQQWQNYPAPLQRALKWLHLAFHKPFRLNDLAHFCAVSPAYLCRLFKRYIGTTPVNYLRRLRLEVARRLLESTSLNVVDVAFLVGFRNFPYFVRQFREHFGKPPTHMRKRSLPSRSVPVTRHPIQREK